MTYENKLLKHTIWMSRLFSPIVEDHISPKDPEKTGRGVANTKSDSCWENTGKHNLFNVKWVVGRNHGACRSPELDGCSHLITYIVTFDGMI